MSWLVWSVENRGWRKAGSRGYTTAAHKAAYYSEDEARKIVDRANVGGRLEGITVPAPDPMLVEIDFRKENTIFSGMLKGEICYCGNPAAHVVEQMIPIDDPKPNRQPLRTFLCDDHFREIMGPAAWLSRKANSGQ
jgi:hypothetical protein